MYTHTHIIRYVCTCVSDIDIYIAYNFYFSQRKCVHLSEAPFYLPWSPSSMVRCGVRLYYCINSEKDCSDLALCIYIYCSVSNQSYSRDHVIILFYFFLILISSFLSRNQLSSCSSPYSQQVATLLNLVLFKGQRLCGGTRNCSRGLTC